MALTPLVGLISSYSCLAIPLLFFFQRPQRLARETRLIFIYAIFSFIHDRLHQFFDTTGMYYTLSFIFAIVEYLLFAALLYRLLQKKRNKKWVIAGNFFFFITVDNQLMQSMMLHFLVNLLRNVFFVTAIIQTFQHEDVGELKG